MVTVGISLYMWTVTIRFSDSETLRLQKTKTKKNKNYLFPLKILFCHGRLVYSFLFFVHLGTPPHTLFVFLKAVCIWTQYHWDEFLCGFMISGVIWFTEMEPVVMHSSILQEPAMQCICKMSPDMYVSILIQKLHE